MGSITFTIKTTNADAVEWLTLYSAKQVYGNLNPMRLGLDGYGFPSTTPTYTKTSFKSSWHGYDFGSVTVRNGDVINSATLELTVSSIDNNTGLPGGGGDGTVNATIFGVDRDNGQVNNNGSDVDTWGYATTPTSSNASPSGQIKTTAFTTITINSTGRKSYNVKTIVEEITQRAGWAKNNDLAFVIRSDETTFSNALINSIEAGGTANDPNLLIDFGATFDGRVTIF